MKLKIGKIYLLCVVLLLVKATATASKTDRTSQKRREKQKYKSRERSIFSQMEAKSARLVGKKELPNTVNGRYVMKKLLGHGWVSLVYLAVDSITHEEVVVKLTPLSEGDQSTDRMIKLHRLKREYDMYNLLNGTRLLKVHWYGEFEYKISRKSKRYQALVIEKVGMSILDQQKKLNRMWTFEDIYQVGSNVILDLEQIHDRSYTHNDMHFGNIAFEKTGRLEKMKYSVRLFDYNDCMPYRNPSTLVPLPSKTYPKFNAGLTISLTKYSPPCLYQQTLCTRRDDLISLGYMLIMLSSKYSNCFSLFGFKCSTEAEPTGNQYSFSPPLPWAKFLRDDLISYMSNISYSILNSPNNYADHLPIPYRKYFEYVTYSLDDATTRPDYNYLLNILSDIRTMNPNIVHY